MSESTGARRQAAVWKKVLSAIGVLTLLALLALYVVASRVSTRWTTMAAGLTDAGEPVTFADLAAALPAIPDEENLALQFDALRPELATLSHEASAKSIIAFSQHVDIFEGIPTDAIEPTRLLLDRHKPLLERLRNLPDHERGLVQHDWTLPPTEWATATDYGHFRTATRLVTARQMVDLLSGRTDDLVADVRVCWKTAGAVCDDPTAIGALIRMSCDAQARSLMEAALRVGEVPPDWLLAWDARLRAQASEDRLLWPLRGERVYALACCEPFSATGSPAAGGTRGAGFGPVTDLNRIKVVELFAPIMEHRNDPVRLVAAAAEMDARTQELGKLYMFATMSVAPLESFARLHARGLAEISCTRLALAAERYRMDTGNLPDTLHALVPRYIESVPIDPFDGKPIKLAATANGITIYSAFTKGPDKNPSGDDSTEPDSNASFRLYRFDRRDAPTILPPPADE